MANRERGDIALTVGGRTYCLRITTDAMCQLEDLLSAREGAPVSFFEFLRRLEGFRVTEVRQFLWAALLYENPKATLADATALIDDVGGPIELLNEIKALAGTAEPDAGDKEVLEAIPGAHPPKARRGAGGRLNSSRAASGSVEPTSGPSRSVSSGANS